MWIYFRSAARLCPTYRLLDRFISRPSFLLLLPVVAYSSCSGTSRKMSNRFTNGIFLQIAQNEHCVRMYIFLMRSCMAVYNPEHKTLRAATELYSPIYKCHFCDNLINYLVTLFTIKCLTSVNLSDRLSRCYLIRNK